jgi:ATP-dependent Zn protease
MKHRREIEVLAQQLLEKETLTGPEVHMLLSKLEKEVKPSIVEKPLEIWS